MEFEPFLAYEASAGSGKTFALVVRYLSLLFMGARCERILALTFTNKAASEMKERLFDVLRHLPQRKSELCMLENLLGINKQEILLKQEEILKDFLAADLKIMTIDKFFNMILRRFALHVGVAPDFRVVSSSQKRALERKFLKLVEISGKRDLLVKFALREEKRLGDIFELLEGLYQKEGEIGGFVPGYPAASPSAAGSMEAMQKIYDFISNCPQASSRALDTVKCHSVEEILEKDWLKRESLNYVTFAKCYKPELDELFFELKAALEEYLGLRELAFLGGLWELYLLYRSAHRALLKEAGELEFGDVTLLVHDLLTRGIDREFLYFRLDSRIDHILIDEFQDTSVVQFDILKPLVEEIRSGYGAKTNRSFFYVGDVKQSIYRFRGGNKELFDQVARDFDVKILPLATNWRSEHAVVEFVNDVFGSVMARYIPQKSAKIEVAGYIKVAQEKDISKAIVREVKTLLSRLIPPETIAVLCFTNDDCLKVEEALLREIEGVQVLTETTSKLIAYRKVSALIEALKFIYFGEELYRANFLASLGLHWRSEADFSGINKDEPPFLIIQKIIERFSFFDGDENLLRFMEISADFKDLGSFVFGYESIDEPIAKRSQKGINILTIHKSKGLEYEHVIVADRFTKKPSGNAPLIFEYEGTRLRTIYCRIKNRDSVDAHYKRVIEHEKRLMAEDELNGLYVAFTRAKNSLIVLKKEKSSAFDILELDEIQRGILPEGSRATPSVQPALRLECPSKNHCEPIWQTLEYEPCYYGPQKEFVALKGDEGHDPRAITFGLAMHYCLEMMGSFDVQSLDVAYEATLNRFGNLLDQEELSDIYSRIVRLLDSKEFIKLTQGVVRKEQPLCFNGQIGRIDLIVEQDEAIIVVDYKSSLQNQMKHRLQVQRYRQQVQEILQQKTQGFICYLLSDEIRIVEV